MAATKDISIRENDLNEALLSAIKLHSRSTSHSHTNCHSCRTHHRSSSLPVPFQAIFLCDSCIEDLPSILSKVIKIDSKVAFETLKKRENKRASARLAARRRKQTSVESMARPYVEIGLAQVFAEAIARDHSISDSVLDLWEATWWKQYEPEDPMITSVLNGQFTEAEAKWMDTFRSDHLDLVWALLNDSVTTEWAKALLDSGFNGNIEQVTAALDGGSPKIIARISKLKCNADMIPPGLDSPADCIEPSIPVASAEPQPESEPEPEPVTFSDYVYDVEQYIGNMKKIQASKKISELGLAASGQSSRSRLAKIVNTVAECETNFKSLSKLDKKSLNSIATDLRIKGRSTMTKGDLIKSIRRTCKDVKTWAMSVVEPS